MLPNTYLTKMYPPHRGAPPLKGVNPLLIILSPWETTSPTISPLDIHRSKHLIQDHQATSYKALKMQQPPINRNQLMTTHKITSYQWTLTKQVDMPLIYHIVYHHSHESNFHSTHARYLKNNQFFNLLATLPRHIPILPRIVDHQGLHLHRNSPYHLMNVITIPSRYTKKWLHLKYVHLHYQLHSPQLD